MYPFVANIPICLQTASHPQAQAEGMYPRWPAALRRGQGRQHRAQRRRLAQEAQQEQEIGQEARYVTNLHGIQHLK